MGYNNGVPDWPGGQSDPITFNQGDFVTNSNQQFLYDQTRNFQSGLGDDPRGGFGSLEARLDAGSFPALAIAGASVLSGSLTVNDDITMANGTPTLTLRDTNAGGDAAQVRQFFQDTAQSDLAVLGITETGNSNFFIENLVSGANINLRTAGTGFVRVGTPSAQTGPQAGDLNAQRLFSNGSEVTCYPFERAYGTFNQAEWDALMSPDPVTGSSRPHAKAAEFAARNDLDITAYCTSLKTRKALPNFPTKAEWPQWGMMELGDFCSRLLEALEVQAVHIEQLQGRIEQLEAT